MKQIILLTIFFFCSFSIDSYSQKIEQNEVDEFTGDIKKSTSFELLYMGFDFTTYHRFSKINDSYYLNLKIMLASGSVFAIGKDEELMLKLANNEIVKLKNSSYTITSRGGGAKDIIGSNAMGLSVYYRITKTQLETLKKHSLSKIRIYTTENYLEASVKAKKASKFTKAVDLMM